MSEYPALRNDEPSCCAPELRTKIRELEAEVAGMHTLIGKLTIGALDFCSIHGNMRKSDLPWPCGMCEEQRAEAAKSALHELQTKLHMTRAELQLVTGELNAGEWRTIKAVFAWLLKEPEHE